MVHNSTSGKWCKISDIPVHGDTLSGKANNTIRILFENVDGFVVPDERDKKPNKNKYKQSYLNNLFSRLEIDIFGATETRQQYDLLSHSQSLSKQMGLREGTKCQTSHNIHERFAKIQQGGTCMVANEEVSQYVTSQGSDEEGLGRWSWMRLAGSGAATRIITAYIPCVTRKKAITATIAQQKRYWRLQGEYQCPRKLLRRDLVAKMLQWREEGDKLILILDGNENMKNGQLARMLRIPDLDMKDAVKSRSGMDGPATFVRGSRQIDAAWVTPDIEISAASFLPFFFGVGDHRAIMLDIPQHSLIGGNIHQISRPNARRLQCNRQEIQQKYNNDLEIYCAKHRIQQKIYALFPPIHPATKETTLAMEAIDKVLTEGMINAEKKCRKIRAGAVPFSDKLAKSGRCIEVWNLVIRHKERNQVNTRLIRRKAKKAGLTQVLAVSLASARHKLSRAWKRYKRLKKSAHNLRHEFLLDQEDKAISEKSKKEIRCIRRHEETRRSWRAINRSQGKSRSNGISAVQVQNGEDWVTLEAKEDVEPAIMNNNSARFSLTEKTPLMSKHMSDKLGYLADTDYSSDILDGKFTPDPAMDEYTNKFLSFIGKRRKLTTFSADVLRKDFIQFWKGAREKTSSSLSGRHFGHYKAASRNNNISEIHASFQHMASKSGIRLTRWAKGLTVMLEKIEGNIKVSKLRAILLMEADFNQMNKLLFGHRMIKQSEKEMRIPDEAYGSRASLNAILVAVNRRLVIDLFKQKRRCGAIAGVDAAQCYDRIVHSLSILLCQKEGAPMSSLLMMFGIIQCMTYYIRTTFGDSKGSYGGNKDIPFQGTCQGNGASPAIWLLISVYLVLLMKEEGHVSNIRSPMSGIVLTLVGFLFVDDTDLVVMGEKDEDETEVYSRLQQSINFWNGILRVSGGALKPEKCYWYFARFLWTNGKWRLSEEEPPPITITDDNGRTNNIDFKQPSEATKAVGVWQDLTGSSTKQVTELISKVRTIHAAISKSPLPRHLNWIGLRQAIWKSIEYVLTATTLSRVEAAHLAKELYRPLLPKLGCNRNFPLLLRYNPPFLLGLGLHDPYLEQGLRKLELLLTHGGLDSMTGQLLQSSLEHHQLEIGSFTPFFQLLFRDYIHLTSPTWMTVLWEFVCEHDIDLSHHSSPRMGPLRINDRALMDILKEHDITTAVSTSINRVRGYLEVFTLADITTGDGNKIRQCFQLGIKSDTKSLWDWHEERPSPLDFSRWKWAMTLLVDETKKLHTPLGKWIAKPHHDWLWYYAMKDDKIYRKGPTSWTSFILGRSATRSNPIYFQDTNVTVAPTGISLTTVKVISNRIIVFEGTDFTDKNDIPNSMAVKCNSFWILDNSNIKNRYTELWVAAGLLNGTLRAVCDGSYKPKLTDKGTTAAWIIEDDASSSNIAGTVATRGITADAYRGELLGIYAILSAISYIEKYNRHFTMGSINIGCDNEKAGWISGKSNPTVSSTSKHFDLVRAIRRLSHSLNTTVTFYHIYGHQDKNLPYHLLPRPAQLNVIVDDLAQVAFDKSHENSSFLSNVFFHHEGWSVAIGGVKLQDKILPHIRNWVAKRKLRKYLFEKDLIAWNMFSLIDFEVLRIYMSAQSRAFQLWYAKHWTNFCGIGVKMKQMKLWDNDLCPCCQQVPESTTMHLYLCPHPTISMAREKSFHKILTWLDTIHTEPLLLEIITAFWHGENLTLDEECPQSLKNIYTTLRDIGLNQMWMGMIPVGMIEHQTEHYQLIGSRKSGKKWGLDLVQKMVRATHGLWMERNNLLHLRAANGIRGLCNIALQTAVSQQYNLGHEGMEEEDFYLLETDEEELIKEPAEMIRGWLCEILIARGDLASARLESLRDRGEITHVIPILSATEQRSYLDWRRVCIQRKN